MISDNVKEDCIKEFNYMMHNILLFRGHESDFDPGGPHNGVWEAVAFFQSFYVPCLHDVSCRGVSREVLDELLVADTVLIYNRAFEDHIDLTFQRNDTAVLKLQIAQRSTFRAFRREHGSGEMEVLGWQPIVEPFRNAIEASLLLEAIDA